MCVCACVLCLVPSVRRRYSSMAVRSAKAGRWAWPSRTTTTGSSWATSPRTGTGISSTRTLTSLHVSCSKTKSIQTKERRQNKPSPIFSFDFYPPHSPNYQTSTSVWPNPRFISFFFLIIIDRFFFVSAWQKKILARWIHVCFLNDALSSNPYKCNHFGPLVFPDRPFWCGTCF